MECDIARREPAAPLSNAPRAKKAVDGAIDALRSDIVSGQVAQGARLPSERDLAAHYGVSQLKSSHGSLNRLKCRLARSIELTDTSDADF